MLQLNMRRQSFEILDGLMRNNSSKNNNDELVVMAVEEDSQMKLYFPAINYTEFMDNPCSKELIKLLVEDDFFQQAEEAVDILLQVQSQKDQLKNFYSVMNTLINKVKIKQLTLLAEIVVFRINTMSLSVNQSDSDNFDILLSFPVPQLGSLTLKFNLQNKTLSFGFTSE